MKIYSKQISLAKEDRRNSSKLYNPMKLNELNKIFPNLNLIDYANIFTIPEDHIDGDEIVIVANQTFFEKLHQLLQQTPSE